MSQDHCGLGFFSRKREWKDRIKESFIKFNIFLYNYIELYRMWWNLVKGTCPRHAWNHFSFFSLTLTVLYESISLLTQSNPIKKAPMKTCSWKPCSWQFLLQTHIFKEVGNRIFLAANGLRFT